MASPHVWLCAHCRRVIGIVAGTHVVIEIATKNGRRRREIVAPLPVLQRCDWCGHRNERKAS